MQTNKQKDLTQVKGGLLPAGLNLESVGSFVFMNITKPKPIPTDIAQRCIDVLAEQLLQLEVKKQNCTQKEILPTYNYEMHKLSMQQLYYTECARLFIKQPTILNNTI